MMRDGEVWYHWRSRESLPDPNPYDFPTIDMRVDPAPDDGHGSTTPVPYDGTLRIRQVGRRGSGRNRPHS